MQRMLLLTAIPLLVAFAPVPAIRPLRDPDRDIQQFALQAQQYAASAEGRKRRLLGRLDELHDRLLQGGRVSEAGVIRDLQVLVESVDAERPLGEGKPGELVRQAAVGGKYRRLLHALYVPADQGSYSTFQDFGYWNGNAYAGQSNLRAGYWVYVHPRWFIWAEGPPVQTVQP